MQLQALESKMIGKCKPHMHVKLVYCCYGEGFSNFKIKIVSLVIDSESTLFRMILRKILKTLTKPKNAYRCKYFLAYRGLLFGLSVNTESDPSTRRGVLSTLNSLFDPIWLTAPLTLEVIAAKIMSCSSSTDWEDVHKRWKI